MPFWIVIIVLVPIIGGLITEYQKNKIKLMNHSQHNEDEIDDLHKLVHSLKSRIENLEAIAAGDDEINHPAKKRLTDLEIDRSEIKKENRRTVSKKANQPSRHV